MNDVKPQPIPPEVEKLFNETERELKRLGKKGFVMVLDGQMLRYRWINCALGELADYLTMARASIVDQLKRSLN